MMWWNGDMGWWPGWISGFAMLAFWALVILGIVLLVRSLSGKQQQGPPPPHQPPPGQPPYPPHGHPPYSPTPAEQATQALAILRERYARGEIDRDEYLQKKADLEG